MSRGTDIAASALTTAAAAVNAVPVYGQFAAAGLAIAAGLTKLFGDIDGPRKKRQRRHAAAQQQFLNDQRMKQQQQIDASMQPAGGQLRTGQVPPPQTTMPVPAPQAPVFGVQNPGGQPPPTNGVQ